MDNPQSPRREGIYPPRARGEIAFVSYQGYYPVYIRLALNPPSGFSLLIFLQLVSFFYSLYLFFSKTKQKNTSFSLRSNPLGYSREPILQRLISQQGNSRWPTCSRKKRSAMSTAPNTTAPMVAVLGLRVHLITAKHSFRR